MGDRGWDGGPDGGGSIRVVPAGSTSGVFRSWVCGGGSVPLPLLPCVTTGAAGVTVSPVTVDGSDAPTSGGITGVEDPTTGGMTGTDVWGGGPMT